MAWIESHQQILDHPKTRRLMKLMEWDVDTAIGKLHRLWWWCISYASDGDLSLYTLQDLGDAVGLSGDEAKKFIAAMIQSRWLDAEPYLRIHDWWDYAGPLLRVKYRRHPGSWRRIMLLYKSEDDTDEQKRSELNFATYSG